MPEKPELSDRCIHCLEPIHAEATCCPHCLKWQVQYINPRSRKFLLAIILLVMPLIILMALAFVGIIKEMKEDPTGKPAVKVLSSGYGIQTTERGTYVTVYGELENLSGKTWETPNIQVKFYNSKGEFIDVVEQNDLNMVLLPRARACFKITTNAVRVPQEYARHEVTVPWALKGAWFKWKR